MIRPLLKRASFLAIALSAFVAFSASVVRAQDSAAPAQPAAQRTDGQIEMDVVHALDASQPLKNDLITAATIQSEVTLAGTVASDANRKLAESIAAQVPGVTGVHNNLKVGNPQDAQNSMTPQEDNSGMPVAENSQPGQDTQQAEANGPVQDQGQYAPPQQYPQAQYPQNQYPQNQAQYPQGAPPRPPYRQGGQYGQYPQQQQQAPAPAEYAQAEGPVTLPQGTMLQLRTSESVDSHRAEAGTPVQFTVIQDVAYGGVLAIPRGAVVHGVVTETKEAGQLAGKPELALTLNSLDLGGRTYPLQTDQFMVKGPNKAAGTAGKAVFGALLGAVIGGAAGGGTGAAIGAVAGGGAGTVASAASRGTPAWIPAEALVTFRLTQPVTVTPVGPQEAARLAQGLYRGGPRLHRRGYPQYGPYGPRFAGGYGYPYGGYPPVYYRPYYMMGGFYYWR